MGGRTAAISGFVRLTLLGAAVWAIPAGTRAATPAPVGEWATVDDTTGRETGRVRIVSAHGFLTGRVVAIADPRERDAVCDDCPGEWKGRPVMGLPILRKVSRLPKDAGWGGGTILDPENGKTYRVRLRLLDGGKRLQVRGYLGPFYRTQIWRRVDRRRGEKIWKTPKRKS